MAKLPVIPVPAGLRFQPVDTAEVAHRLVELTRGEPAGLVPELAGPRVYEMRDLVRGYLAAANRRRPILPIRLAGRTYRAMRAGANLSPDRAVGLRTWEDFLAEQIGRPLAAADDPGRDPGRSRSAPSGPAASSRPIVSTATTATGKDHRNGPFG